MSILGKGNSEHEPADISMILQDIASLRDDIASVARGLTKDVGDSVSARGGRVAKAIGHQITDQPAVSLLIAFALGAAATRLLSRV